VQTGARSDASIASATLRECAYAISPFRRMFEDDGNCLNGLLRIASNFDAHDRDHL